MANCGNLLKSALVAIILVFVVQSASAQEKLASCCKIVSNQEITEPILGYLVQKPSPPCVLAVIFQTEKGLFCRQLTAPWVRSKIKAFEKAKALATPSTVVPSSTASLLSIITSTASPASSSTPLSTSSSISSTLPPSSSSSLPSFPSTSEMPAEETFSESHDE
ncbi:hypothetical protein L3Q82_018313 [Scortum barcoo]|uniref:Uncharacterized protein n=1 Tax=Scortum barcoo TaxID=214431 RepID=A0ACB8VIM3_9TELE|nr:hypothetical protein L3Q82_018313 [Scortum barcoo]